MSGFLGGKPTDDEEEVGPRRMSGPELPKVSGSTAPSWLP